jgi:acyl dehydratase
LSDSSLQKGIVLDHAVDLRNVRLGDRLDIPYELTVSETLQDFWTAAFFDQSRIHSSRPFCRQMGLQDRVVPFSLALFLASSMSHADAAKVQVGFGRVSYLWPIFAGDTLRKSFTVHQIRNTSDGNHSLIHFTCDLSNQRGRLCMRADKRMLFPFPVTENKRSAVEQYDEPDVVDTQLFRNHLLSKATTVLAEQPSHSLAVLKPGQLILHSMHRSLPFSTSQQLASLARLTHERHFDIRKYDAGSEILIPGGLVLGCALSASARDLHEVLHEEIQHCSYVNALHPDQVVGAVSYVSHVDDSLPGDLENVTVTTVGIKNVNVKRDLGDVGFPVDLFRSGLFAKDIEQICKEKCPTLSNKIVVQVERKILRQASHQEVFLL